VRSMALVPVSSSKFFCWIGVNAASTTSSLAPCSLAIAAISSTWPLPSKVAARGDRTRNALRATTSMPIASASPSASSTRASILRRTWLPASSGTARTARSPRATSIAPLPSKLFRIHLRVPGFVRAEVERARRLQGRDGVLVDQLGLSAAFEQQGKLIEARDRALQHDTVDEENRHRVGVPCDRR